MPSEESFRTDASTVHRSGEEPEIVARDGGDIDQIAEARTVIRGSSRSEVPRDGAEPMDRSPAAVAKVLLGQRLNHFRLDALIGGGGMGAVFRAQDEKLDRTVAIKVIPFVGDDPDLQRRFRNEAQSAAKLDHPRIAKVFDAGSHGQWHYIVFEYVEGTNIRDSVHSQGPLSIDEAVFYTSQLAGALQHAADRGIVHRDIKPSNVLIGNEGKIKLVDMGLARSDNLELSEDMTASGVTLGTFDYISPEQAQDPRDADLRSDIYSLGCTLYFMLTGNPPYPGGTMLQKLLSHGNAPPPDVRQLRPEVSGNLVAVMEKMLAKDPASRYQTANDLIADLREVAFRDGLTRSQALGPVAFNQPNPLVSWLENHAPWIVAMVLLVVSAGWLQLESAASREELKIPNTAAPPTNGPAAGVVPEPTTVVQPTSQVPGDDRQVPTDALRREPQSIATPPAEAVSSTFSPPLPPRPAEPLLSDMPISSDLPVPGGLVVSSDLIMPSVQTSPLSGDSLSSGAGDHGADSAAGTDLDPLLPRVIRVLGPGFEAGNDRNAEGASLVPTLAQALEIAAQYGTGRIEIDVPIIYSEPVRVDVDGLVITSTLSGGSVIMFQPNDSVAMERSKMFTIGSHPIEFRNLHFVWNVPSGEVDGGTLFELNDNHLIMADCSITVSNPTLREEVYALDVVTDPEKIDSPRRDPSGEKDSFPLVWIDMSNVVVRGQITMLHMDYAAKLRLFWENGLLAITDSMIDTAGARHEPPATSDPIQLSLTRVTAHAPRGLMRMRVGVSGAYPVAVDRFARKSVFVVDSGRPSFEFTGLKSLPTSSSLLRLRGGSNAYVVEPSLIDPMLRIQAADGEERITRMNDLVTATPAWVDEISPRWSVNWSALQLSNALPSERRIADYRQNDPYDPSPPGFDEKTMPRIPEWDSGIQDVSRTQSAERTPPIREEL